jgi:ParB family chromosome partitioning protein
MNERRDLKIHIIPLDRITVVNPRQRGERKFKQIVDKIAKLGLKRPVTVTPS